MLSTVAKARDEIIAKLETVSQLKPGMFVTPVATLKHHAHVASAPTSAREQGPELTESASKLLEMQSENSREQLSFFLRAQKLHDANLKKNMEFALNCLRKREELDQM